MDVIEKKPVETGAAGKPVWFSRWKLHMAFVGLALTGCIAMMWLHKPAPADGFQYYGTYVGKEAPDFTLTDQDGKPLQLSSLRGKVVLMTFGFTHCPNICPTTLANMAAIYRGLQAEAQKKVQVVFVSVDPERDTPAVLKQYVPYFQAGFMGATGSADEIAKVAKDYGVFYEKQMTNSDVAADFYTINHSPYIYLISPEGKYDLLYDNDKFGDTQSVTKDILHELHAAADSRL